MSHVNAWVLKVKPATAIIDIGSIQQLKASIHTENHTEMVPRWPTVSDITGLFSALAFALAKRPMTPAGPPRHD